jgi:hypothetical protein
MGGATEQEVAVQDPVILQTVFSHVAERVPENPELHVGVHVEPKAAPELQFPGVESVKVGKDPQVVETQEPDTAQVP